MEFYLKLNKPEDDLKLKGITLFEDFGKKYYKDCKAVLQLGVGKTEYRVSSTEEIFIDYFFEMENTMAYIASILPDARMCYSSIEDEGSGESDTLLKMENDNNIYHCGTVCFEDEEYDFGTDEWCEQAIRQYQAEKEEWDELYDILHNT